jgi:UDP-N-acetylglucosamine acyltransferase
VIGSHTVLRESVVIQGGRSTPTTVGDNGFLMAHTYVAHDARVEGHVTLSASVALAGHSWIGAGANLGMGAAVRQHVRVGAGTMVGMGAVVVQDLPALALAIGIPARATGANRIGLDRAGFTRDEVDELDEMLRAQGRSSLDSGISLDAGTRLSALERKYRELLEGRA